MNALRLYKLYGLNSSVLGKLIHSKYFMRWPFFCSIMILYKLWMLYMQAEEEEERRASVGNSGRINLGVTGVIVSWP